MKRAFLIIVPLLLFSCDPEISIDAPYKKIPVVQSFLNVADTVHWVKVTKLFSGAGSVPESAQIPDSSYFDMVTGVVIEKDGNTERTFVLRDTTVQNREPGYFYYPEQKLYYFRATDLKTDAEYRVELDIDEGDLTAFAPTQDAGFNLLDVTNITTSPTISASGMSLYQFFNNEDNFKTIAFEWSAISNSEIYSASLVMSYEEYYTNGTSEIKYITVSSTNIDPIAEPQSQYRINLNGKTFYDAIAANINDNSGVEKRVFRDVHCEVYAGDANTRTLYDIQQPSNGINQIRPNFSNVLYFDNITLPGEIQAGRGIVSSRSYFERTEVKLNRLSTEYLCEGAITGDLLFCSDDPAYSTEGFYCN